MCFGIFESGSLDLGLWVSCVRYGPLVGLGSVGRRSSAEEGGPREVRAALAVLLPLLRAALAMLCPLLLPRDWREKVEVEEETETAGCGRGTPHVPSCLASAALAASVRASFSSDKVCICR